MKKSLLLKIVSVILVVVGFVSSVNAQVTTSSMVGTVKDSKDGLPGASIKATHTPTGSVYTVITNSVGRFTIGNMRVGGPYSVEVSFVGFKTQKIDDVYLKLGEAFVLNVTLEDNSSTLQTVTVVGAGSNPILNSNKTGTNTVVSRQQIQSLPTISRSVNDITRLTPQANGSNIGGGNYRSNNFTVDGANFNNQFGIGQNIPAGGSPISIDALEQISINVTPYDVRQTGFVGGSVSAVTRSGTNNFTGSAFYTQRGDGEQGSKVLGKEIAVKNALDEKNFGFTFGGPIVKNKLFFFANYEKKVTTQPGNNRIAATPERPYNSFSNVAPVTASLMDEIRSYLRGTYNYDPGVYQGYPNVSDNEKMFFRLDWNINQNHKFSVRYNQVESKSPSNASTSVTGSGVTGVLSYGNQRSGSNQDAGLNFANSNYYQAANLYSAVAELNSKISNKVSNVARFTISHQNDPRTVEGGDFPLVDILDGTQSSSSAGKVLTTFGYEPFSYGNLRDVKTYTYSDELLFSLGRHNVTLGAQAEFSTTKNGFQRFGTGFYTFASWNDFKNNARPLQYTVTYPLTADGSQAFPSFKFAQYSGYIQDEWTVSDRFKVTLGLRVEQATYPDVTEIKTHPLVAAQTFANGEKVDTGELPESRMMFSPRFGFNWDVKGDRSVQIRGGSGIFTGRIPFVWLVSQSGDAGMLQYTQVYSGANTPFFNPSIAPNLQSAAPAAGSSIPGTISSISKDIKFPQVWKSSLGIDVKLPFGVVGTLEGIYSKDLNAVYGQNVNLKDPTITVTGYADQRLFYPNSVNGRQAVNMTSAGIPSATGTSALNVAKMRNIDGGYNWMATAQLSKQFSNGLSAMVAYTKADQRNYGDQSGDQLLNLWSIPQTVGNSNIANLSYSNNLSPNRIIGSLSYRKEWLQNLATSISVFYEGAIAGRYSYVYSADFNRDGQNNDLIYVPNSASELTFEAIPAGTNGYARAYSGTEQADLFMAFIDQDPYLKSRKGQYAERSGAKLPWRNQFDVRITQEVFRNIGKTKNSFEFTADIFNFGNLLNSDWGTVKFARNANILIPRNVSSISATTKPTFRLASGGSDIIRESFGTSETISSTYYMQFGVRYKF
ncbi:TonB-dependent receptor [Pedobacter ureilyticus]|uniref:TonB-dependent receptor domain-containing protein n=1 Tax=Pedobacter ureilyticus TaxID=1393051 RepID=A0ABW9J0N7_9SPHI|nr:TonB-dependent receptor [Pedobacter helvus]